LLAKTFKPKETIYPSFDQEDAPEEVAKLIDEFLQKA